GGGVVTNELCKMGEGLLYHYTRPKVGQKKIAVLDGLHQPDVFTNDGNSLLLESWREITDAPQIRRYEYLLSCSAIISMIVLLTQYAIH
ncbi:MAG: hypothetical protein D3922_10395, partial [Candidatus Electrothrix sp. AR1]|nr:hypothetical protein [Candidatus Electrothrix sp. AR1]